jgi:catabolite regulation protein CreA
MAIIMLAFMLSMYGDKRKNIAIFVGSTVLILTSYGIVRAQSTVGDVSWMKAMIPHHSIAILTSERADLSDPRVQELARQIIETQRQEIAEMERLIADLEDE